MIINEVVGHLHDFSELTATAANQRNDHLYLDTRHARLIARAIAAKDDVRRGSRDYDGIESQLVDLAANRSFVNVRKGYGASYGPNLPRATVLQRHTEIVDVLRKFKRVADANLVAQLQAELQEPVHRYGQLKADAGRVDFVDLLLKTRDVIRDHDEVRVDFQSRYTHILVDEFQDTDPLQAEILLLLAADDPGQRDWHHVRPRPGKLFIVGDPKQAIYRFRRADVGTYYEVKAQLEPRGVSLLSLTTSFRSVPSIQHAVNHAFAPLMVGSPDGVATQAQYVPLSPRRDDPETQPTLVALSVPRPYGMRRVAATAIERSLPGAVGGFIEWLLRESGWTVTERAAERVPVTARHICVLFRRFESFGSDVTRAYVDALEARGVPHLLVGGRTFHAREEVATVRSALSAIEWPDDQLSVFATLRGSLFAIEDQLLFEYHQPIPSSASVPDADRAWSRPRAATNHSIGCCLISDALEVSFRDLHPTSQRCTGYRHHSVVCSRRHAPMPAFVMRPAGEQALANVLQSRRARAAVRSDRRSLVSGFRRASP